MGADLWWTPTLPGVTTELVEQVLALAEQSGLSPRHPDGHLNGFDHESDRRLLTRDELVNGMVTGEWGTNLWDRAEMDIGLSTRHRRLMLSQDAVYHGGSRELITELAAAARRAARRRSPDAQRGERDHVAGEIDAVRFARLHLAYLIG
jgi:hypothetical protein